MQGCIYLITNLVNGKKYVGQHNKPDAKRRFQIHISVSKSGNRNYALHKAMNKYGLDNFICETLCICSLEALDNLEAYYAEQYGTYTWDDNPGYNMVWCGEGTGRRGIKQSEISKKKRSDILKGKKRKPTSEETKKKLSEFNIGKKLSEEHSKKISDALMGKKRKPFTEETRRKMSEARKKVVAQKKLQNPSPS